MERLTRRSDTGHAYYPRCFEEPCNRRCEDCLFDVTICKRLAAYEDTGLEPEEVLPKDKADEIALKLMRLADLESLCNYDRLRELAEADKDGRVVVLPCQSGEHVFALLDDQKRVRECEVKQAVLDGWRKTFYIVPVCGLGDAYSAPFGAFGKTVFLTREEAEKALEAMREEEAT